MSTITADELPGERQAPKRRGLNFWVDLLTAVQFSVLLGSGLLMKYVLPPGTCDAPVLKTWLGHARHWWGDIHWWIAVSLIVTIVLHVYLHWKWVTGVWGRLVGGLRSPQTWALAGGMAALIALPLLIPPHAELLPTTAPAVEGAAPAVAPCGIAGASCADCPASGDRLFGGASCAEEANAGEQTDPAAHSGTADEEDAAGNVPEAEPPSRLF